MPQLMFLPSNIPVLSLALDFSSFFDSCRRIRSCACAIFAEPFSASTTSKSSPPGTSSLISRAVHLLVTRANEQKLQKHDYESI
jgi:hypothetical protein